MSMSVEPEVNAGCLVQYRDVHPNPGPQVLSYRLPCGDSAQLQSLKPSTILCLVEHPGRQIGLRSLAVAVPCAQHSIA